jgi:hypothetical protein
MKCVKLNTPDKVSPVYLFANGATVRRALSSEGGNTCIIWGGHVVYAEEQFDEVVAAITKAFPD